MHKNIRETAATQYVVSVTIAKNPKTFITGVTIGEENHGVDDAWLITTARTAYPLENKTIMGDFCFKEDGEFRDYFKVDLPNKMKLECEIPENTPIYYVNAESIGSGPAKWDKLIVSGACLSFLAADGIVFFTPITLKEAFLGFGYAKVPHKTELAHSGEKHWEKKAILDLSKGKFIKCNTPKELIKKKYDKE